MLDSIAPFFIVRDVIPSIAFYRDRLGFQVVFVAPDDGPFVALVEREGARVMLKAIVPEVQALPNHTRHPWAKWDAFVLAPDPDSLFAELSSRGATMRAPLADTDNQLRGFEVQDPDGYVLFFGRPIQ